MDKEVEAFTLRLPPEVKARLKQQAKEIGLSFTGYVRMLLTERANLVAKGKLPR